MLFCSENLLIRVFLRLDRTQAFVNLAWLFNNRSENIFDISIRSLLNSQNFWVSVTVFHINILYQAIYFQIFQSACQLKRQRWHNAQPVRAAS